MSKRRNGFNSWFTTYFVVFSYLLVALETFSAGIDAHHRWFMQMTFDLVIAAFWAGLGIVFSRMAYKDGKLDGDLEGLEKMGEMLERLTEAEKAREEKPDHKKQLTETLMAIMNEVTGGNRPPKPNEVATIAAKFHEATGDHYVKLTLETGGMRVEIKDQPFEKPKPRKPRASRAKKLEQTELVPEKDAK